MPVVVVMTEEAHRYLGGQRRIAEMDRVTAGTVAGTTKVRHGTM
jgi:hypothetical protein